MTGFEYTEILPLGPDETDYRLLTADGLGTLETGSRRFLTIEPEVLTELTRTAMHEIAHYLRASHLGQLRSILDDPEASANDRFVALDLLKNACISAGGVLPMCQDTGTAIVKGKKGQSVLTGGRDEEAIARGVYDTFQHDNLRYSQMAPLTMWDEANTRGVVQRRPPGAGRDHPRRRVPRAAGSTTRPGSSPRSPRTTSTTWSSAST